ncbi:MAG: NADP-dependent malic enzyme, partial [Alphaproteobacteria bacterium]|nr:NADP-dependent malic enzyme [Alphaproteobacteria bacterium]
NLFIMPNIESASIAFNMVKVLSEGINVGPLLLGVSQPAHILTPAVTPRGIVNVTALATVAAQIIEDEQQQPAQESAPRKKVSAL